MVEVVAAAAAVHAPQLLSRPPHEDFSKLDASTDALQDFGRALGDAAPEAIILIGLDHLETFWLEAVPTFTVVMSPQVEARYMDERRRVHVHTDLATQIVRGVVARDIDVTYSQEAVLGHAFLTPLRYIVGEQDIPIVPILVNAYLPPLPSPRRAYGFGVAIRAALADRDERVAVIASGGMSHFPGTSRYHEPNFAFDEWVIQEVANGRYDDLLSLSPVNLDEVGENELLTWFTALGIIGTIPGRLKTYQRLSHHGHGVVQFLPAITEPPVGVTQIPRFGGQSFQFSDYHYYRFPEPRSLPLNRLLHRLIADGGFRSDFVAHRERVVRASGVTTEEAQALLSSDDFAALTALGAHPLLALSARQVVEIERRHHQAVAS